MCENFGNVISIFQSIFQILLLNEKEREREREGIIDIIDTYECIFEIRMNIR